MIKPLEITFTGMDRSDFVEDSVRKHLKHVERLFTDLTSCYVSVAAPHKSHRKGNHFEVRVLAHLPGHELSVSNQPGDENTHEDMRAVIRDCFNALEAQLRSVKNKKQRRDHSGIKPEVPNDDLPEVD